MIGPGTDAWGADGGLDNGQTAWQERERRQRSVRFLMMFLLMMLLMDGEEQNQRRHAHDNNYLRKKARSERDAPLSHSLYLDRREQDNSILAAAQNHPRYQYLINRNQGIDYGKEVQLWANSQLDLQKDEFAQLEGIEPSMKDTGSEEENAESVFYFPWNSTGFYRGDWTRKQTPRVEAYDEKPALEAKDTPEKEGPVLLSSAEAEEYMFEILKLRQETLGVHHLPQGMQLEMQNKSASIDAESNRGNPAQHTLLRATDSMNKGGVADGARIGRQISLTKASGRVAFQLYSRSVPAMKEISIIDGLVKMYDSNTIGYSTRRDILLRVNGVLIHSLGRISLVSKSTPGRSALVIEKAKTDQLQRRLREALESDSYDMRLDQIRDDALDLFLADKRSRESTPTLHSTLTSLEWDSLGNDLGYHDGKDRVAVHRRLTSTNAPKHNISMASREHSRFVIPYPFVADDTEQTLQQTPAQATRRMPPREEPLFLNAGSCDFEINMNVQEEEWGLENWRHWAWKQENDIIQLNPSGREKDINQGTEKTHNSDTTKSIIGQSKKGPKWRQSIQDQSLVMTMNGTIFSPNCDNFTAVVNATALRTDWDHAAGKAINYSFYMMLTCLSQIVLLLRQLLHTQAQSAAPKVSLLCVGWQAILDGVICLIHIFLSMAIPLAFTALASVAFFKFLIFCVIERKFMAIVLQARNANGTGNSVELLRRQIAMLHLRFYVALMCTFIAFFYTWESYHRVFVLVLYSFWLPQIIRNIVTEAKRPLHPYYVYGISLTRLVAPLYIFCTRSNFLKEVYPDIPTDLFMCELLIVWIGVQTAVLEAQGRYGARFMIPARFLPPKYDYSRPIPSSLLPPGFQQLTPSESLQKERSSMDARPVLSQDTSIAVGGARNRIKGSRVNRGASGMTSETVAPPCPDPSLPNFDCVICYNEIDIRNRTGYMLAPCDHIFHKECLLHWMDVKMECPVCRMELPVL
eukprot:scaffold1378_cov137-Cylindrotheca_fusiformis.AAC.4